MADGGSQLNSGEILAAESESVGATAAHHHRIDLVSRLLTFNLFGALLAQGCFAIGLFTVFEIYSDSASALNLNAWTFCALILVLAGLLMDARIFLQKKSHAEMAKAWRKPSRILMALGDVLAFFIIILLMPTGTADEDLLMVIFFMGYVLFHIMADPGERDLNRACIVALMSALVIFFLWRGGVRGWVLATYMAMYGAIIFIVGDVIRTAFVQAVAGNEEKAGQIFSLSNSERVTREAADEKSKFFASASHDLNQPLFAVRVHASRLARAPNDASRLSAREDLDIALDETDQHLSRLLEFLRLDGNQTKPNLSQVAMSDFLRRLADRYRELAKENKIALVVESVKLTIATDATLLTRALSNLIENAIKHSGCRKVIIGAKVGQRKIRFEVADDGKGLGCCDPKSLFVAFGRGTETPILRGYGLGLASVDRIARKLDGNCGAKANDKGGAIFWLELPLGKPS